MNYEMSLNKETDGDHLLCIESFKLSLLAKSCLTPGLISFVTNLIKSSEDPPEPTEKGSTMLGKSWDWLPEYWEGKAYEIYRILIPRPSMK